VILGNFVLRFVRQGGENTRLGRSLIVFLNVSLGSIGPCESSRGFAVIRIRTFLLESFFGMSEGQAGVAIWEGKLGSVWERWVSFLPTTLP